MNRYILTFQAKLDLREIKNYIGQNNLTAARRFVEEFREQSQLIVKFPEMGRSYSAIALDIQGSRYEYGKKSTGLDIKVDYCFQHSIFNGITSLIRLKSLS